MKKHHLLIISLLSLTLALLLAVVFQTKPKESFAVGSGPINYTALGDSITIGYDEVPFSERFVNKYASYVATDLESEVNTTNLGVGGLDIKQFIRRA